MAALVSPPDSVNMSEPSPGMSRDPRPSAFTAINAAYSSRPDSDRHLMGDTITVQTHKAPYEPSQSSDRPTPPPSRQDDLDYRNGNYPVSENGHHQLPSPTDTLLHGTKRKRDDSSSTSPGMQHQQESNSAMDQSENSEDYHYPPQSIDRPRDISADGNPNFDDRSNPETANTSRNSPSETSREPYASLRDSYQRYSPTNSRRPNSALPHLNGGPRWGPPTSYPAPYSHDLVHNHPQQQMGASPHQEVGHHDHSPNEWRLQSTNHEPLAKDGNYADSIHAQLGPKRKRNFSNRTKTGCITCRRRKKKCDEGHPFCQNCMRGGFKCDGYTGRTPWPKPSNAKAPVPLQSKEGFSGEQESRYPGEGYPHQQSQPPGPHANQSHQPQRPLANEQIEPPGGKYMPSPAPSSNQQPLPPAWPSTTPSLLRPEKPPRADYRDLPQLQNPDLINGAKEYRTVLSVTELSGARAESAHPGSGVSWSNETPPGSRTTYAPPSSVALRSAIPPPSAVPPSSVESRYGDKAAVDRQDEIDRLANASEKEKMIGCRIFKFMDPELKEDRKRCKDNLWRFNNAENPAFGIPENERHRLLKQVLQSSSDGPNMSPLSPEGPTGSLGPNARVEIPFTCHYGYNIHIGEDVYIGENCTIIDSCSVKIGARAWIGSNVQILTAMAHTDLQYRKGSNSSWQGKEVVIEEDVYIGAGAIIYPGVRLARGTYIEPGSTVKGNMLEYSYMGYKPGFLY